MSATDISMQITFNTKQEHVFFYSNNVIIRNKFFRAWQAFFPADQHNDRARHLRTFLEFKSMGLVFSRITLERLILLSYAFVSKKEVLS